MASVNARHMSAPAIAFGAETTRAPRARLAGVLLPIAPGIFEFLQKNNFRSDLRQLVVMRERDYHRPQPPPVLVRAARPPTPLLCEPPPTPRDAVAEVVGEVMHVGRRLTNEYRPRFLHQRVPTKVA